MTLWSKAKNIAACLEQLTFVPLLQFHYCWLFRGFSDHPAFKNILFAVLLLPYHNTEL